MTGTPKNDLNSEHRKVVILYAAAIVALAFQFLPEPVFQVLSIVMLIALTATIKVYAAPARDGTLLHNHAVYLARTIKIWLAFLFVTIVAAGLYMQTQYDFMALMEIVQTFAQGKIDTDEARRFAMIGVAAIAPSTVYLAYRVIKGLVFAIRAKKMENLKSVF